MFKKLCLVLLFCRATVCVFAQTNSIPVYSKLVPSQQESIVCRQVAGIISQGNYKKVPLNDSLSLIIYNKFIKKIDPGHNYLLASDIAGFDNLKTKLSHELEQGDLNDMFNIFDVYLKRYNDRVQYSIKQLDKDYTFTTNEMFTYNRESSPWITTEAEMDQVWSLRVKYDLLSLKLGEPDLQKDKETLRKRYRSMLKQSAELTNQDVFQMVMNAFTESIDPHTDYFNPANAAQFNVLMSRSVEGIGARLTIENEYITIKSVTPGGPAYKSKQIDVDDRIIGIAQGTNGEFQDVFGWRLDNALALIRGTRGTVVRLKLLPKGNGASDKPKIVEMTREKIIEQDQSAKQEIRTYNQNGKPVKIGFISIPQFYIDYKAMNAGDPDYKSTTRDVKLLLDTLKSKNVDGVIIDLRGNGGGSLTEVISLTGLFTKPGPVVQVKNSQGKVAIDRDQDLPVVYDGPLAVMVDRFSASASEIFAGAMQDYGRALVIGNNTWGKGTVQTQIELDKIIKASADNMTAGTQSNSTGSQSKYGQLNLTIAKFYRISGVSTQLKGVSPDITFPSIISPEKYGEETESSALPFDTIRKAEFEKAGDLAQFIAPLQKLHNERMSKSLNYKCLMEDISDYKKRAEETSVTLNESKLKAQRDNDEKKAFERDNLRREALGLPVLKKGDKKPKNEDLDFLKIEAGQILIDYTSLK